MFSTIKAKLIALIAVAVVAIVSASLSGIVGMRSGSGAVKELGGNYLPSVLGLMTIARGQLEGRVANREMELLEIDEEASSKIGGLLEKKYAAFARMEKGAKIYEPLPRSPEEEEIWKQAKKDWAEWKVLNDKLNAMLAEIAKVKSKAELEALFVAIGKHRRTVAPSANALTAGIDKLIEINSKLSEDYAQSSSAQMSVMSMVMNAVAGVAVLAILLLGLYVFRSTMKQLGGEPGVAAEVAKRIAVGDLSSRIELKPGDSSSLMASMQQMSATIQTLVADANALSGAAQQGKLATRADAAKHQGEFRAIIEGINATMNAVVEPLNDVKRVMAAVERGDLTQSIDADYQGDFGVLQTSVNNTVDKLSTIIAQVRSSSDELTNASTQVASTSQVLSQATSEQAASLEETTSAIEQMSASIAQNTDNAKTTDGIARKSSEDALAGGGAVRSTVAAMKSIAGKISIIDDIAYRTDLLALNAAIEAARAGEQGRGFAVVADEVRKLAERTSSATIEIEQMIAGIQQDTVQVVGVMDAALPQVAAGVEAAESAADSLRQIKDGAQSTLDSIREVADSTHEQSVASNSIAQKVEEIATMVDETTAAMHSTAETAADLEKIAGELTVLVSRFRC